jgi:hypothetical protein
MQRSLSLAAKKKRSPSRFQEAIAQNSIHSVKFYSDFAPDIFHPHYPLGQGVLGSKYLNYLKAIRHRIGLLDTSFEG